MIVIRPSQNCHPIIRNIVSIVVCYRLSGEGLTYDDSFRHADAKKAQLGHESTHKIECDISDFLPTRVNY